MRKINLIIFLLLISFRSLNAQNSFSESNSKFQYGISTKVSIEFGARTNKGVKFKKRFYWPAYKISLTGGIGHLIGNDISFFPSLNTGVLFFNRGSIGANQSKRPRKIQSHFFANGVLTSKLDKKDFSVFERNVPLYHFSEFTANPLQNPYKTSLSFGVNLIFVDNSQHQWVGFFNANFASRFQVSYYNDGGPILGWPGDNRDRFYTGGVIFSYHGNFSDLIDLAELSYHKYTGYQKYAFDVADKLQIDFLNYFDDKQFSYNQQRWRLNVSSLKSGFGGSFSLYNVNKLDFQDFLHFTTDVPYHPDYYRGWRWMIGARHEYNNTTTTR